MHEDSELPPRDPPEEPTVLDYFMSVTRDWRSFSAFLRSFWDSGWREDLDLDLVEARQEAAAQPAALPVDELPARSDLRPFPWRSILALCVALYAQLILEPPSRVAGLALPLYLLALALVFWAYLRREWRLPEPRPFQSAPEPLTARLIPLFASLVLALMAFWDFGAGVFTLRNVALWVLAIVLLAVGLWLPFPAAPGSSPDRRRSLLTFALIVGALGISMFFRLNRLEAVPAEPFSDHAEKILDIYDITQGKTSIFFPRNTGREAFQMYWTWLVAGIFGTGLSFLSLKIGTVLLGLLTLPYVFLLGRELGNTRVGLLALFLFGVAYWPNVLSRMGLRFPLYALFLAPTLYHLVRGLRTHARSDFILSGLFLGIGLHGYSPFRIVPILVLAAFIIFLLHRQSRSTREQAVWWLAIILVVSLYVFLPLLRYALSHPEVFSYRALSRMGSLEVPLPGPAWQIFLGNLWNALLMFNWDDGEIWVHSVPHRPALDVVTAALFLIGSLLLIVRWFRSRDWRDLLLLVSVPILLLPSVLSLAFPGENPALNRAAAAALPAVLIAALALEGLINAFGTDRIRLWFAAALTVVLLAGSAMQNHDLVFRQFDRNYRGGIWNSSEMGEAIQEFWRLYGPSESVWVVPYPHWVDTRLPALWVGIPNRDLALWPGSFEDSLAKPSPKLFILRPEDVESARTLLELYPDGRISRYTSAYPGKDFITLVVQP